MSTFPLMHATKLRRYASFSFSIARDCKIPFHYLYITNVHVLSWPESLHECTATSEDE